jgi:hypothetical protein
MMDYQIQKMISILTDKVLRLERVNSDRDYAGGGWYDEASYAVYLYSDMSFRYVIKTFRSVSGGGLSMPYENKEEYIGAWSVVNENFKIYLILTFENYTQQKYETENLGQGLQRLGGQTWNRYLIQ